MGKRRDWDKIGEAVEKVKKLGLTYVDGAKKLKMNVEDIYDYNHRENKERKKGGKAVTEKVEKDSAPKSKLPEDLQKIILDYRRKHPSHGFKRIESELIGKKLDFSKGYLVFKVEDHSLSVVYSFCALQVFLDGALLEPVRS